MSGPKQKPVKNRTPGYGGTEATKTIVKIANQVLDAMNTGAKGANKVNTTDAAFIRGFNSQLYLEYGMVWDGVPGSDF